MEGEIQDLDEFDPDEKAGRALWPFLLVRSGVAALAGIILLAWPQIGLAVVAVILGIVLVLDGIERLVTALRSRSTQSTGTEVLAIVGALFRIIFGAVLIFNPVGAGGFWVSLVFILTGLNLVIGSLAIIWRERSLGDGWNASHAVLSLILGLLLLLLPLFTALFLFRLLGVVLILSAIPPIVMALRYRK